MCNIKSDEELSKQWRLLFLYIGDYGFYIYLLKFVAICPVAL
ncbi:hypothetical protein CFSAN001628_015133 [Clostridium botulinum CFSAN001628]|uniref:Uncharacterized protein n=1 Tax=Clostridium botulinum (strain Okra / Type B1) TaxID=498213 RepID=B1IER5_CLOBK|nr:hypothetical protein CLD_0031 [Clostridium botulinum B1 str. Okra]EKX79122.1 hypothetical protein CFSAN001628_015133 [Clostridium botulinum CFSAN001628]